MHIRQLTETDVEVYRALRLHSLRESPHAFTNSYEEFSQRTLDSIAQQFRGHENFTLGAFEDDQLVGMVGFYRETRVETAAQRLHRQHVRAAGVSIARHRAGAADRSDRSRQTPARSEAASCSASSSRRPRPNACTNHWASSCMAANRMP